MSKSELKRLAIQRAGAQSRAGEAEANLTDELAAAIKEYGEVCHDCGLGNPMNLAQMNRLYALTQDKWEKVSKILDALKADN